MKVEKVAKNGQMVQNSKPLSPTNPDSGEPAETTSCQKEGKYLPYGEHQAQWRHPWEEPHGVEVCNCRSPTSQVMR